MNNINVSQNLYQCWATLKDIKKLINERPLSGSERYLTLYALMLTTGTFESSYKQLLYDYTCLTTCSRTKNYLYQNLLESSKNPSLDNIHNILKKFDEQWNKAVKQSLKAHKRHAQILTSIKSLNDLRNTFAHGRQSQSATFKDICQYFRDACIVLFYLDKTVR